MPEGEVPRIGFLGAGKMATALARGWMAAGLARPDRMMASDPLPEARQAFNESTSIRAEADNKAVATGCDLLILAVKPQSMSALLAGVQPLITHRHLIVSIAAGVSLQQLAA